MIEIDFKYYMSVFWKRFPILLLIWVLFTVLSVAVAFVLPAMYRSQAKILVESANITLVDETVRAPAEEQIQKIETLLMTRANLLEIADLFDLYSRSDGLSPTEIVEQMREATEFEQVSFTASRGGGQRGQTTTAFSVSFVHVSPVVASRVANEMLTRIMERNRDIRADKAIDTRDYFKQERTRLLNQLTDLETQIVNMKNENKDSLPERLDFNQAEMARNQDRLIQMDRQELAIKEQRDQLQRVLEDPILLRNTTAGRTQTPQERELEQLTLELAQKSTIYSETNPQIIQLRSRIDALEDIVLGLNDEADEDGALALALRPIKDQILQLDNQLALLKDQRLSIEVELDRLQRAINETPNVENQLNILEREHATTERQYDSNEEKLALAEAGANIETLGQGERFTVIEQPQIPDEVESPNRILISAGGTGFGLVLGIGMIILLEMLDTSIRRPADLINGLGIQPFATIPYIPTRREIIRRRLRIAAQIVLLALLIPAVVFAIHQFVIPVDLLLERVLDRFGLTSLTNQLS